MSELWPAWSREWLDVALPAIQIVLIVMAAWLLQRLARRLIRRLDERNVPPEMTTVTRRVSAVLIYGTALLLVLQRLGVSAAVLWTAFTGFAAVAAVAFFAVWSVLSNIFCSVIIFVTRPFRIYERIELLENGEKPGLRGRVVDINLIYTTLQEDPLEEGQPGNILQIPNSLFFQRAVRRYRNHAG
jgi:small-conductance mechanosensitive channel